MAGSNTAFNIPVLKTKQSERIHYGLTELMGSHDLPRSKVTNQIAFDHRDFRPIPEFKHAMDRRCQASVSKSETLRTITLT